MAKKKEIINNPFTSITSKILNRLKFSKGKINKNESNSVRGQIEVIEVQGVQKKALSEKELREYIANGKAKLIIQKKNTIVNSGLNWEADRFYQNSLNPMSHIAVGDDDTAVVSTDVALGSELARVSASFTDTNNITTATALFNAGVGTGNWKEACISNASSGGIMYNRVNIDYIKGAGIATYVVFTITRNNA